MEKRKRSIVKTISWRVLATLITVVLVYLFTKRLDIAGVVGGLELGIKLVVYYLHERSWNKIQWGKQ